MEVTDLGQCHCFVQQADSHFFLLTLLMETWACAVAPGSKLIPSLYFVLLLVVEIFTEITTSRSISIYADPC